MDDLFECAICHDEFHGFGNNPQPLAEEGRCCDDCNVDVIVARMFGMLAKPLEVTDGKADRD